MTHDLSLVHVAEDFAGCCRVDAAGRLLAELVELDFVNSIGLITEVEVAVATLRC